jgi:hypothetical protein
MRKIMLAGALAAVLVSPAFAQDASNPRDPNDPYKTDASHLGAQSLEKEQGLDVKTSPQAGTTDWDRGQSTTGKSNSDDEPNRRVLEEERQRG